MIRELLPSIVSLGLLSCQAHVRLTPPAAGAPAEEREQTYNRLRPWTLGQVTQTQTVTSPDGQVVQSSKLVTNYMLLADGTLVYYPEDLIPVVPMDSPTAKAAEESARCRFDLTASWAIAVPAVLGGLGLMLSASSLDRSNHFSVDTSQARGVAGIGLMVGGLVTMAISAWVWGLAMNDTATMAFGTYNASLRQALNLPAKEAVLPLLSP
jgi:hypothetical protein